MKWSGATWQKGSPACCTGAVRRMRGVKRSLPATLAADSRTRSPRIRSGRSCQLRDWKCKEEVVLLKFETIIVEFTTEKTLKIIISGPPFSDDTFQVLLTHRRASGEPVHR